MKIKEKIFTKEHLEECEYIKQQARDKFNLTPVNNICLILLKLKELNERKGHYVECGTYRGNTLIPSALYAEYHGYFQNQKLIGVDTFKGFPSTTQHDPRDLPTYFKTLRSQNQITEDHFKKSKLRTENFQNVSHLENTYFLDTQEVFNNCSKFKNISLLQGTFDSILPNFKEKISILHLDGDLYKSYLTCLENLYDNVIDGGVVIFDEYYSHKYPGARVAVNEFFLDKNGHFEKYLTIEGHERWCFIKKI
jgi:hypothetical protein|tara:strand:+ start:11734 stop:12486 length:753 start_codon:yes stop_codon:yes gene_type:complete